MGLVGSLINYGTPAGWAGMAAEGTGLTDKNLGDVVEDEGGKLLHGMDRGAEAESRYPMQDREAYDLPGYAARDERLMGLADRYGGREAPQSAGLGRASAFGGRQWALGDMLMRRARGEDSLAQEQLRQAAGQNIAQQQSFLASAPQSQAAMAGRMAMQNAGRINQGLAGQSALAGIQERTAAGNALGSLLSQARGQDQSRQGMNLQNQQFNVGAQQRQMDLNQQAQLQALQQAAQNAQMQQQGAFQYGGDLGQRFSAVSGQPTETENLLGLIKGGAQTAAGMG